MFDIESFVHIFDENVMDMAFTVNEIPALTGKSAERFVEISESNLSKRASVDFSKEAENSFAILNKKPKNK